MQVDTVVKKSRSIWCAKPTTLPINSFRLEKWDIDVIIRKDIDDVAQTWDNLTPDESFAQSGYLKTLELTNPPHLNNLYVVLSQQGNDIGIVLLQSLVLRLSESFDYDNYTTDRSFFSRLWQRIRQIAVSLVTFRMLTVGNLYLTGQYGIHFSSEDIDKEEQFKIVGNLIKVLRKELCSTDYRFNGVLYKDFFDDDTTAESKTLGLYGFKIDPNMILQMRPSWLTFDDYLLDMKSKYRVRLKNALKKFKGIERKVLSEKDIVHLNPKMYALYSSVLEGSGFVLAMGGDQYFLELKRQLGEELQVIGYFKEDELVGFYTWVMEGDKMDSHFIGFDSSINNRYQIYLNILLDLVRDAISQKARSLYFFRTALEIKSSVGSTPFDMTVYFKHMNRLINSVMPTILKYMVPQQNWKQRHPFKSEANK